MEQITVAIPLNGSNKTLQAKPKQAGTWCNTSTVIVHLPTTQREPSQGHVRHKLANYLIFVIITNKVPVLPGRNYLRNFDFMAMWCSMPGTFEAPNNVMNSTSNVHQVGIMMRPSQTCKAQLGCRCTATSHIAFHLSRQHQQMPQVMMHP
jgi:hypothetical protein